MLLTSPRLSKITGIRHGFSTREGGVSTGPYKSLNLGRDVDDPANVDENRRRFVAALGLVDPIVQVDQVHGNLVRDAEGAAGAKADGLFTTKPNVAVGVRTADCAPVLVAATNEDDAVIAVAAIHAGWRGATASIVERGIEALEAVGADRRRMTFAIGPTIGIDNFEVGPEVIEAAAASLGGETPPGMTAVSGKPHLDLVGLLVRQLERLEVDMTRVETVGGCTFADPSLFFSHRRDKGVTGRHLSAIAFEAPSC